MKTIKTLIHRSSIIFFISASCMITSLLFVREKKAPRTKLEPLKPTKKNAKPLIVIKQGSLKESVQNQQYEIFITSAKSNVYHESSEITCYDITCNIHTQNNNHGKLTSEQGIIKRNQKLIVFPKNVIGLFGNYIYNSSHLTYNLETHTLKTDEKTVIKSSNFRLQANKTEAWLEKDIIEFSGGVETELRLPENQQLL